MEPAGPGQAQTRSDPKAGPGSPPARHQMGSNPVPNPLAAARLHHPLLSRRVAMARGGAAAAASVLRPWLLDLVPLLVVLLIAAHVVALGYWIYRLATDGSKQPARSKNH